MLIQKLDQQKMADLLPEFMKLESNWTGIGEDAWTEEQFMRDMDGKWDTSVYASTPEMVVGYALGAVSNDTGRLTKLVVDREFRGQGIAQQLWDGFVSNCEGLGLGKLEFKALTDNDAATRFYLKNSSAITGVSVGSDGKKRNCFTYSIPKRIGHSKPSIYGEDINAVSNALKNGDVATGKVVERLIDMFAEFHSMKYGFSAASGSDALFFALKGLGVKKNDRVIVPDYVCASVMRAVDRAGGVPVIADINEDDYNISYSDVLQKTRNKKARAVIVPHMFGNPVRDIELFSKLGIPVVEDCAQSLGAELKTGRVGSFGDSSVFSFYATKMITSGYGGMVLTSDAETAKKIEELKNHDKQEVYSEAYNSGISDFQAALALSQFSRLGEIVKRRKEIAAQYDNAFRGRFEIVGNGGAYFRYILRVENAQEMIDRLREKGIDAAHPTYRPLHQYLEMPDDNFPNSTRAHKRAVSIPIYPSLSDGDVKRIVREVIEA